MQIFINSWFERFARKNTITTTDLRKVVVRINKGLIDADLGGGVLKQRIARPGQGRSKGYRSIILFRENDKAFFVYCFSKNDQENITPSEVEEFKNMAIHVLTLSPHQIERLIELGTFKEIKNEG